MSLTKACSITFMSTEFSKVENCFTLRCLEQESAIIERDWRRMIDGSSFEVGSHYVASPLMQYIWDYISSCRVCST